MQRVVIDTNTWISGLVWAGAPRQIVQLVLTNQLLSYTSDELLAELKCIALSTDQHGAD